MNYLEEKKNIFKNHLILFKNFKIRKNFSDIKHIELYKELKSFIESIIYKKKILIYNYEYTVQEFFNISNEEVIEIKKINLEFISKIIYQETYSKSIEFIQNYSGEIEKLETNLENIFTNIFKRLFIY